MLNDDLVDVSGRWSKLCAEEVGEASDVTLLYFDDTGDGRLENMPVLSGPWGATCLEVHLPTGDRCVPSDPRTAEQISQSHTMRFLAHATHVGRLQNEYISNEGQNGSK